MSGEKKKCALLGEIRKLFEGTCEGEGKIKQDNTDETKYMLFLYFLKQQNYLLLTDRK